MPAVSRRGLIRKFRSLGFEGPFSAEKPQFMIRGSQKIRIPNPHVGDVDISLMREILSQAGISSQDWEKA